MIHPKDQQEAKSYNDSDCESYRRCDAPQKAFLTACELKNAQMVRFKDWCDNGNAYFFDNNEQKTHTTEELLTLFLDNEK